MKRTGTILLVGLALVLALVTGGLFHLYNTKQEETRQQATISLDQGIALFRENKYTESLELLQGIPDGLIDDWHLPYYTATALVMLKDYQPAALLLEEALVLNPQETAILFELGVVYFKLGNLGLSKGYFASVIEIDPGNEEAKGLMDIMAKLERNQPGANQQDTVEDNDIGAEGH